MTTSLYSPNSILAFSDFESLFNVNIDWTVMPDCSSWDLPTRSTQRTYLLDCGGDITLENWHSAL